MKDSSNISGSRQSAGGQASTSSTLIDRVKQGNAEAWRRLKSLYLPLLLWWCRSKGLRQADAEDVAQEVFRTVALKIAHPTKGWHGGNFRAWLRDITFKKVGDQYRRLHKEPQAAGGSEAQELLAQVPEASDGSTNPPVVSEQAILCRRALELVRPEFKPRTWEAVWRVVVEGQCPVDAAADLGMSASAVYTAKSRVLSRLREELQGLLE